MAEDPLHQHSIYRQEGKFVGQPALVIGNGESRLQFDLKEVPETVTTFGCNAVYRDFQADFICSVDPNMVTEVAKSSYEGKFIIPVQREKQILANPNKRIEPILFDIVRGWSAGPTAVYAAAFMGFNPIFLLGYDMGYSPNDGKVNNVYRDTTNYRTSNSPLTHWENWEKQLTRVFGDFVGKCEFFQLGHQSLRETWAREATWVDFLIHAQREVQA